MPPLTLTILASVLHMQGADATITSDNKGIDELLAPIREQLQQQADPSEPRIILATKNYTKEVHSRGMYDRSGYLKKNISAINPAVKPASGTAVKPTSGSSGGHR